MELTREQALDLLKQYNKEPFHLRHALTVEAVMGWFAKQLGYGEQADFWSQAGLLHDLDFEQYPEEHCVKARELMEGLDLDPALIHAVVCHGWGMTKCDVQPEHEMERVLFAVDELTGLIGAAALMRPSKSVQDMELSSLKKKFKDKRFAAGCSRETIAQGAELLGWELNDLLERTLQAMKDCEADIEAQCSAL
ncbi:hydrolase [Flavonifractor hominis]|uniref:Hydrolase n=1 Tax=Flavonifractor hominis TaxID=3133178 RepID=A0ABV1EJY3_9FIRM